MNTFELWRNESGRLVYLKPALGLMAEDVLPVRPFPITDPGVGISLLDAKGRELEWIGDLALLSDETRALLLEELGRREFLPRITKLTRVSSFATPSTWEVETDRGPTHFVLAGEENIHRVGKTTLLISSREGVWFAIRDVSELDAGSRRILDRFR